MQDNNRAIDTSFARPIRALRLTWAGLLAERLVRCFWPVWSLVFGLVAVLAFDLHLAAPLRAIWIMAGLWGLALLFFVVAGFWRFRWPSRAEALARLDAALPGRPLATLADRQAVGAADPASAAVWQAHLARMAERASQARPVQPDLRLSRRDPFALRYAALLAFMLAVMFGSLWKVAEVGALAPTTMRLEARAGGPAWEGWVQPPAYTGRPSLYLNELDRPTVILPEGSRVTVRLYGDSGVLSLAETVSGRDPEDAGPADAPAHDFEILRAGRINVQGPGGRGWEVTVLPDAAPRVRLRGEPERQSRGAFRQEFEASDDYGVVAGEAEIRLDLAAVERRFGLEAEPEPREPIRLDLPMPIAGDRSQFTEALIENLSEHPWANLPVTLQLSVTDARGQTGESALLDTVLPGRRFFDPLAAAIVEMRRDLLWNRETAPRVAQVLRAVSHRPDDVFRSERAFLLLRTALRQLEAGIADGLTSETRDDVAGALWDIALLIEEGELADALERLRRAQDQLAEAMRSGADAGEIADLMQELREAMRDYMRQLAEQGPQEGNEQFAEGERMEMSGDQLQEMMDRIQELMEQGRMAEAMELMELLNQMLENMQVTQGQGGDGGDNDQAMRGLGEALRDQQELSDDTFREFQEGGQGQAGPAPPSGTPGTGGEGQGEGEGEGQGETGTAGPSDLADRQRNLRDRLAEIERNGLPGEGSEAGEAAREALEDAGRAMEEAERALREDDSPGALQRQAEAIDAMRESLRNMGEAMARDSSGIEDDRALSGRDGQGRRDPLGREVGEVGRIGTDDELLQGEDVYRRARDILEEIRRRSGEQERPELELDYLRRLLERF